MPRSAKFVHTYLWNCYLLKIAASFDGMYDSDLKEDHTRAYMISMFDVFIIQNSQSFTRVEVFNNVQFHLVRSLRTYSNNVAIYTEDIYEIAIYWRSSFDGMYDSDLQMDQTPMISIFCVFIIHNSQSSVQIPWQLNMFNHFQFYHLVRSSPTHS